LDLSFSSVAGRSAFCQALEVRSSLFAQQYDLKFRNAASDVALLGLDGDRSFLGIAQFVTAAFFQSQGRSLALVLLLFRSAVF
jgi:hypothetical protein